MSIFALMAILTLISCSKEKVNQPDPYPQAGDNYYLTSEISNFLGGFYEGTTSFGDSIDVTEGGVTYRVTEILVDEATPARGYIAQDLSSGDLVYFVDVDRTNYEATSIDFINEDTLFVTNIDTLSDYSKTNSFDVIGVLDDDYGLDYGARKFWGWGDQICDPCVNNRQTCRRSYYIFWIRQSTQTNCCYPC